MAELNEVQECAVAQEGGPLLVLGGPGTGKTRVLVERFVRLVERGAEAEDVLLLGASPAAADRLRGQVEERLPGSFGELAVHAVGDLSARLVREHALAAGVDPFFVPLSSADRVALLLDRIDRLTLRRHEFLGNPAALIGSVVERIDRCKLELVSADDLAAWAAGIEGERGEREREFAAVFAEHDRLLAEERTLDAGDLVRRAVEVARGGQRFAHVLVDDLQDAEPAHVELIDALGASGAITAAGDDDSAFARSRTTGTQNLRAFAAGARGEGVPEPTVITLERSFRCREAVLRAGRTVAARNADRLGLDVSGAPGGDVRFWRCEDERAQAQSAAAEVERLVREGVEPARIGVLVRSVRAEGRAVALALEERAVPHRVVGAAAFFQRAEVRDVLAWLRLLSDPSDAGAFVRALARPPIELRSADIARCVQIARRRRLDMPAALVAATESPQLPPEGRDRVLEFLALHGALTAGLDATRPDLFVHRLVERLGLRRQGLFAAHVSVVERLRNLAKVGELASDFVRRSPQATAREFARSIAAVAEAGLREEEVQASERPRSVAVLSMRASKGLEFDHVLVLGLHAARMPGAPDQADPVPAELLRERRAIGLDSPREAHVAAMRRLFHVAATRARRGLVLAFSERSERGAPQTPSPFVEEAREALDADWEGRSEALFGPDETLHATFTSLRDDLLADVGRVGTRLGELRFDTDLDVTHAVVRYLELLKLAALLERPAGQGVADALPSIGARLGEAVTPQQREILLSSGLDDALLEAEREGRARAAEIATRAEPSLEPFLPRRGEGLVLSASDVETYRTCPLKYKFARVFRIPTEPTLSQRFGILVHQVLERFHGAGGGPLEDMHRLLETGWWRGGFGDSDEERQLHGKAVSALERYWERFRTESAEPVWFERGFQFRLGPHTLRGRVDRVDRHPDGGYELLDYKTGRPKTPAQLRDDVQLGVYALAAREAWDLEAARQAYLYVLDDEKVPLPPGAVDPDGITETVHTVAEGILAQGFEPTPSYSACSICDFRIACPAAEV